MGEARRKRILIIEDVAEIRKLIRVSLKREDFEVFEAATGDSGLAMALELKPDLVLLDRMLPGTLNGLSVCRAIKGGPAQPKVLMLTAMRGRENVAEGRDAGADGYILKPFSPLELLAIIDQHLADS